MGNNFSCSKVLLKEIKDVLEITEHIASSLKNNIYWMTGGDIIEELLTKFLKTNNELKEEEKEALKTMAKCAKTVSMARLKSEQVVAQLDGLAKDTLTAIRCHTNVRNTIDMLVKSLRDIKPDLDETIRLFGDVTSSAAELNVALDTIKRFAENTQGNLPTELDSVKKYERNKRHSGAAAGGILGIFASCIFYAQFMHPYVAVGIGVASVIAAGRFAY